MNMFEEAEALSGTMRMCGFSQAEMAKKLGVSQSYVANKLRLLAHDEATRERIIAAGMTERHARALLRLRRGEGLETAIEKIVSEGLNVAGTEALVDLLHTGAAPKRIGRADRCRGIELFKDTLERSVRALVSLGVDAHRTTDYYGSKT